MNTHLKICAVSLLLLALAPSLFAKNDKTVEMFLKVDELGNATLSVDTTLSARDYEQWRNRYGGHPALLRRDFKRDFSAYEIRDFKIDNDDSMSRRVIVTCKALGAAIHERQGHYELTLPKQWEQGEQVGTTFTFFDAQSTGEGVIKETIKVELPPNSDKIEQDKDEYGQRVISYRVPIEGAGAERSFPTGAVIVALLGVVIAGASFFLPKATAQKGPKEDSNY